MKYSRLKEKLKKEDFVKNILYKLMIKEEALEKYKRDYVDKSSSLNLLLKYLDKKRQLNRKIIQIQKIYSKLK